MFAAEKASIGRQRRRVNRFQHQMAAGVDECTFALRIQCAVEVIEAIAMTMSGILRGAGDVKITSFASIVGMWCVRVLLANILIRGFGFGLNGVWIPMALDWVCRFTILFTHYRSGKWREAWAKNTAK